MKKTLAIIFGLFFILFQANFAFSQETEIVEEEEDDGILDGAFVRSHMANRKPVPFQYVREADVMWSKKVWQMVDLRQKMNHKLYYPEYPMEAQNRYSLIDLLMKSIESGELRAYHPTADDYDEFKEEILMDEIKERFGAVDEVIETEDASGKIVKKVIKGTYNTKEVKEYLIKEEWFFDKQRSVLDVRIIGICPIRHFYKPEDIDREQVQKRKLFWIYFPHARKVLANHLAFNPYNDAEHRSFDDIFLKRYYSSYVFQESNTFNNRRINQYTLGIEALYESERVKENIRRFEADLWEY